MKILIVGAGFGGLALAAYLRRDGHVVSIVECRPDKPYSGFILGLWRNALYTLEPFHVIERLQACSFPVVTEMIRDKHGQTLATMDYQPLIERFGPVYLLLHADLYALLRDVTHDVPIRFETTVQRLYDALQGVQVMLSDGSQDTFDLVVGADGVHSQMRQMLFGDDGSSPTGVRLWLYLTPSGTVRLDEPNNLYGEGEYACLLPTKGGRTGVEFLAAVREDDPDPPASTIASLQSRFADFTWRIPDILRSMQHPEDIWQYNITQVTLDHWYRGRVALLGDAAHAVSPMTTMGCAMAFEDAHVLAEELHSVDTPQIEHALIQYESRRKPRVEEIHHTSDFLLWWTSMKEHGLVEVRNMSMRFAPSSMLLRDMTEIINPRNDV